MLIPFRITTAIIGMLVRIGPLVFHLFVDPMTIKRPLGRDLRMQEYLHPASSDTIYQGKYFVDKASASKWQ